MMLKNTTDCAHLYLRRDTNVSVSGFHGCTETSGCTGLHMWQIVMLVGGTGALAAMLATASNILRKHVYRDKVTTSL